MCMTIGPGILFLALCNKTKNRFTDIISVYGRVPFFYYIIHFYLIHLVSMLLYFSRGHSFAEGLHNNQGGFLPNFIKPGEGYSLWVVYGIWISLIIVLYPLCKWYDKYKREHKDNKWLSYL